MQYSLKLIFEKIEITNSCWNWKGGKNYAGYGHCQYKGKQYLAHRYVYELLEGKIPPNMVLDHLCKNTSCVNPAHLDIVTQRENLLRSNNHVAINAIKTNCIRGHEFTPENTYIAKTGQRSCKTCTRERQLLNREKHIIYMKNYYMQRKQTNALLGMTEQ